MASLPRALPFQPGAVPASGPPAVSVAYAALTIPEAGVAPAAAVSIAFAEFTVPPSGGATPPTVFAPLNRPVTHGGSLVLEDTSANATAHSWTVVSGAGTLANVTAASATYTAPATGTGVAVIRHTATNANGSTAADTTIGYSANIVAAENALPGTARATWDLPTNLLGGVTTLQGFVDGFSADKTQTVNFKIAQSDAAGWSAEVYRLGYYSDTGARSYGTLTPTGSQLTASQTQPAPGDADPVTTRLSADCANWSTTLTWTPPSWAPSGMYVLRLNRTGGGASHVLFLLRDDARVADVTLMPSDSTWNAYNAFGGMGANLYTGNSLYYGTAIDQYNADCARFVSYNRPMVNRGSVNLKADSNLYGEVRWSTFFTGEFPMVRFLERNGYDVKYLACIDAAGDPTGAKLIGKTKTAMYIGHNEYWSDGMRASWEAAKAAGVNIFACAGNDVFWRLVGSVNDSAGRPRTWECYKSTIAARASTARPEWTGTWRDPDGAGKGGNAPENTFAGSIFVVNGPSFHTLQVPTTGGYREQPLWRNTTVATSSYTSPAQILGFEWNVPGQGFVSTNANTFLAPPHAQVRYCSTATHSIPSGVLLTDAGDVYDAAGTATHRLTVHPNGASGGITFSTGTINWALGVDNSNTYQLGNDNVSLPIQQATINMLRDMLAAPVTPMAGVTVSEPVSWFGTVTASNPSTAQDAGANATTLALALSGTATAGHLVYAVYALDKLETTITSDPDFTVTENEAFTNATQWAGYRTAAANATDSPSLTWANPRLATACAATYNFGVTGVGQTLRAASQGTAVQTTWSVTGTAATAGLAIATVTIDSANQDATWGTQAQWSSGWTLAARAVGSAGVGAPGAAQAYKQVAAGESLACTFTSNLSDEHILTVVLLTGSPIGGSVAVTSGTGGATTAVSAAATGLAVRTGTGAATATGVGAAAGARVALGTAEATATSVGAAAGVAPRMGAGAATATATGAGVSRLVNAGTGAATAAVEGAGSGAPVTTIPSGTGDATAAVVATSSGSAVRTGAGAATATTTASGAGVAVRVGSAAGTAATVGAAAGAPVLQGSGAGTAATVGAGAGRLVAVLTGTGSATVVVVANGTGQVIGTLRGSGDAAIATTATADGLRIIIGAGAATATSSGAGTGGPPAVFQPWMKYRPELATVTAPIGALTAVTGPAAEVVATDLADTTAELIDLADCGLSALTTPIAGLALASL